MRTYVWDGLTEVEYVSVTELFLINGEKVEREIIFPITADSENQADDLKNLGTDIRKDKNKFKKIIKNLFIFTVILCYNNI